MIVSNQKKLDVGGALPVVEEFPMRVLLADDDEHSRAESKALLELRGHVVYEVKNGEEALDKFLKIMPDLVMIDVHLPGLAGYAASVAMKESSPSRFVPVIFMADHYDDKMAGDISGGDGFLTKPLNLVILNFKLQSFQRIRVMNHKLNEYQRNTEVELETSKHIFNALIDDVNHDVSNLSFWTTSPGHFSGDTGLFKSLANGHVYVLLCDFTGHGLPAAIGTVFVADLFRSMTNKSLDAKMILDEINDKMNQILPIGRYCAAVMLDYDPAALQLKIWNCGLPSAYLIDDKNKILAEFASESVPLGVLKGKANCNAVDVDVQHAKSIIIYSDGVTEAENPEGGMYSEERLKKCIENAEKGVNIFNEIQDNVEEFMDGMQPTDDTSLIVLNFRGGV